MGLRVIAIDTGSSKRDMCLSLGAVAFFDFKSTANMLSEVRAITKSGAHGVLVAAGSSAAYNASCAYLRPTGTLLVVGLPPDTTLDQPLVLLGALGLNVKGIFIGNRKDAVDALELVATGKVKVNYTIRPLSELDQCVGVNPSDITFC